MPQFRLTRSMAKELKLTSLPTPADSSLIFYDDWYLDVFRLGRKKIVCCIHIRTRLAIAILPSDIGGMKALFEFFPFILKHHLHDCQLKDYKKIANEIDVFFRDQLPIFTKTNHLSTQSHMTQFKGLLYAYVEKGSVINQSFCDTVSHHWLKWLIRLPNNPKDYTRPATLWQEHYN